MFVVKAFQRRFRQDLINGNIDQECLMISNNLAKKLREHDLTMLTLRKPGLIERRVNSATDKILKDLESSTATSID